MLLKELALKAITPVTILLEAYRIFNGTLLVIFVPGVCGGKACLPQQNFENGSTLYKVNCGINLVALFVFMALYAIEIQREYKLYAYLCINPEKPSDPPHCSPILIFFTSHSSLLIKLALGRIFFILSIPICIAF